ncbi:MAG: TRAP transporter large permease, partial [Rhodospirillales bacterium]|nr:TRAP transporter large permease [Rhodospirillales bacterium]
MSPQIIGVLGLLGLIVMSLGRVPLGAAMGIVGLVGYAAIDGWDKAFIVFGTTPYSLTHYSFSVLPLFILMGNVATKAGMSQELFAAANALFAGRRGALPMATIGACAGFAAVSGSSLATAATFTRIAVPEMRQYGYDERLATGAVAAGGTLGILIPPSVIMVIYALAAEESVPELFAAGMIPGVILALLFVLVVWVVGLVRPEWSPVGPKMPWGERLVAVMATWKLLLLFGLAVGGIYTGWFSPTEAAGVASFAAIIIGVASGKLGWRSLVECISDSLRTTAMLMFIIAGAWIFAFFVVQTRVPVAIVELIEFLELAPWAVIVVILIFYIILGCVLDSVAIILVTVPVFLPVVAALEYNTVWYGILMVVVVEMGLITPPVG